MSAVLARPEPIIHWDLVQGTDSWHSARAGCWGSSKAAVIMGGLDTGGLKDLIKDVAWGRKYGIPDAGFKNAAMERGQTLESTSIDWYSAEKMVPVHACGMVTHASIPHVIWSPDGVILKPDGSGRLKAGVEAKNPLHRAWMDCRRTNCVPSEYRHQCKWAMWVGQLECLDFVCHHPLAGGIIVECEPDPADWELMEARVALLEKKVAEWIEILERK